MQFNNVSTYIADNTQINYTDTSRDKSKNVELHVHVSVEIYEQMNFLPERSAQAFRR